MANDKLKVANAEKFYELAPHCHNAAFAWMSECWKVGQQFRVSEAYRTQQRQNELYAQGRWKPGKIVTYTLKSLHTQRLAVDIYIIKGSHKKVAEIAAKYGITHPLPFDPPHYQFDKVPAWKPKLSSDARIKMLKKGIARATGKVKEILQRVLKRLIGRLK